MAVRPVPFASWVMHKSNPIFNRKLQIESFIVNFVANQCRDTRSVWQRHSFAILNFCSIWIVCFIFKKKNIDHTVRPSSAHLSPSAVRFTRPSLRYWYAFKFILNVITSNLTIYFLKIKDFVKWSVNTRNFLDES